jgi:diguanylate cyclase (GGDEF)-like protein
MKTPGRQDLLPLVGLAVAIIVLFAPPLTRVFSSARAFEERIGLAILPALAVAAASVAYYALNRRHVTTLSDTVADVRKLEGDLRAEEIERLVAYGQALSRSSDLESIRVTVAQHLPTIAGTDRVWVLIREGTQWEALAGDTRGGPDEVLRWGDLAEQLLTGQTRESLAERAIGFPLMVASSAIGVLGVRTPDGAITADRRRALEASSPLLALAIRQAQLSRELRENSVRDALTGCFTRSHAIEVIDAELRRARRSQAPVSLVMFDIDRLKDINDRHGHLGGDAVLAVIGKRMREVLRGSDLKCRYSGEQFLVLLPETPLAGAKRVAETLRREVADRPVSWSGENLRVTASFGIAQALPSEVNVQAMVGRADHAVYRAKEEGGNCVRIADATLPQPAGDQP